MQTFYRGVVKHRKLILAVFGALFVIGFLALCLMRFGIGPDLGLALAKGVAISLITVFVFSPALILTVYKWLDKLKHRPFLPSFQKFGGPVQKTMLPMVAVFALVMVPAYLASVSNSYYYGASHIFGPETQLGAVTADMTKVNLVAIGAVLLVLVATMRALVAPLLLVLSIETAIWLNLAIPYFAGQSVFYIAYLIISSIQLGATLDYAILFTDRYRELRDKTGDIDTQIQDKIDEKINELTGSGAVPGSFVSAKNTNVKSVQFVIKTAAIELPEVAAAVEAETPSPNFWQKLLALFGL